MKKQITKLGFTLIELLVVITIIGILATGATTIYTSQLQKARDSTRVTSMKALQWAVEQFYSDISEYPSTKTYSATNTNCNVWDWNNDLHCLIYLWYMRKFPKDPKDGQKGTESPLLMLYKVQDDTNTVNNQLYELSIWFEARASVISKASKDAGNDKNRLEAWPAADLINTSFATCTTVKTSTPYDSVSVNCKWKTTWTMFTNGSTWWWDDKVMIVNG